MSSFVLLHADSAATLLAADPIVPANDIARFSDLTTLLEAAAKLQEGAQQARDAVLDAAREQGFAEGHAEGRRAGEASIRDELLRLSQADAERSAAQRADLAKLALEVVRHIAGTVGTPDLMAAIAAQATTTVLPETAATIRVHPDALGAVAERLKPMRHIAVEPDPAIEPTDCILETALGRAHAGLDAQLGQLERAWGLRHDA